MRSLGLRPSHVRKGRGCLVVIPSKPAWRSPHLKPSCMSTIAPYPNLIRLFTLITKKCHWGLALGWPSSLCCVDNMCVEQSQIFESETSKGCVRFNLARLPVSKCERLRSVTVYSVIHVLYSYGKENNAFMLVNAYEDTR